MTEQHEREDLVTIHVNSSAYIHVPGMVQYAQHVYRTDPQAALDLLRSLFNNTVQDEALITILTGEREPVYDLEDLAKDAMAFVFSQSEVNLSRISELTPE